MVFSMYRFLLLLLPAAVIMPYLLEGSVNKCYGGFGHMGGGYLEVKCNKNFDRCFTISCGDAKVESKNCGKCPTPEQVKNLGPGCKCSECHGDMCNANVTRDVVNQCYWGNDQNYEAFDCKVDNNMACQKVKCFGTGKGNVTTDETVYRDCGKCPTKMTEGCKCFQCSDMDLCNAGFRNGSSSFWLIILTMIGGVISLLANWPKQPLFSIIGI